ncbi:MAG TPA: creatininase family protein [Thermohalobaculum sp.]|nr:creatininase family protein [Thermohalobaculum sp.]
MKANRRPDRTLFLLAAVGAAFLAVGLLSLMPVSSAGRLEAVPTDEVFLRDLTWVELRAQVEAGKTTVIIPTGGIEQNGPHMILGKHGYIVTEAARRIAVALGDALVAPTIDTVPEGDIDARAGHMAFPGTISIPEPVFDALIENIARSLKAHGFRRILLLGDSGGNQKAQVSVAARLNAAWLDEGVRVIALSDYYSPANGHLEWLGGKGLSTREIGGHAGIRDTSELMAVNPAGIRRDRLAPFGGEFDEPTGVDGDPNKATEEIGAALLELKVTAALRQIEAKSAKP